MSYTPINTAAFVSAYAGAIGSMSTSGQLFQTNSANYQTITEIAGAFAQAFDVAWNNSAPLNALESQTIQTITAQNFAQHAPSVSGSYTLPATWTAAAQAIKALVLECDIYFASQGISPGSGGGVYSSPYDPATYLPAGVTPAQVDIAKGWKTYILAALVATGGLCQLQNRAYPYLGGMAMGDGYQIEGLGPLSALEPNKEDVNEVQLDFSNTVDVKLKRFIIDSDAQYTNVDQVKGDNASNFEIDGVEFIDFLSVDNSSNNSALHVLGNSYNYVVKNCYAAQNELVPSWDEEVGLNFSNYPLEATINRRFCRAFDNEVKATNLKVGINWDYTGIRNAQCDRNVIYDGNVHGILFGYFSPAAGNYNSTLLGNMVSNCAGCGIDAGGGLGAEPFYEVPGRLIISDNWIDSCGGLIYIFSGINCTMLSALLADNYVFNSGRDMNGVLRVDGASVSGIVHQAQLNFTPTGGVVGHCNSGNLVSGGAGGIQFQCTTGSLTGALVYNTATYGLSVEASYWSGLIGTITVSGCTVFTAGTQGIYNYGCPVNSIAYDVQNNTVWCTGATAQCIRWEGVIYGDCANNVTVGGIGIDFYGPGASLNALGVSSFIRDNHCFTTAGTIGLIRYAVSVAGTQWLLMGANYATVTSQGSNPERLQFLLSYNHYNRIVRADAPPTLAGQLPGGAQVGDQIVLTTPAANIWAYVCRVGGAVGTWNPLPYV